MSVCAQAYGPHHHHLLIFYLCPIFPPVFCFSISPQFLSKQVNNFSLGCTVLDVKSSALVLKWSSVFHSFLVEFYPHLVFKTHWPFAILDESEVGFNFQLESKNLFYVNKKMSEDKEASNRGHYKMTDLDFVKKFKIFNARESKPGALGCFLFCLCLIFCIFLIDYRFVSSLYGKGLFGSWFKSDDFSAKVGFLEVADGECDVFEGNWVWDEGYPLYKSQDCMFLDSGFRCSENGRRDDFYTKWRWQPKNCNLPRFNAELMLEKLRDKRLVFVGDSIGRNQWESLLCMLSSAIQNKSSIYEVNGNPITKHTGFLIFKFKDFNCTVEYYRAPFLVVQGRAPAGAPERVKMALKLDQMDWSSGRWKDADLLVFNTGHWWNYEKTIKGGCYFQEGAEIKMEMSIENALRRSIKTLVDWISRNVNLSKTQVIFRTYAPVHFRGGDWNNGGTCHLEMLPDLTTPPMASESYTEFTNVVEVLSEHQKRVNISLLNVTGMTSQRKDGHSSVYYLGPVTEQAPIRRQDCSHWCLPGVPDTWNELVYAAFLKRDISRSHLT